MPAVRLMRLFGRSGRRGWNIVILNLEQFLYETPSKGFSLNDKKSCKEK
jgi:hypothetical protein